MHRMRGTQAPCWQSRKESDKGVGVIMVDGGNLTPREQPCDIPRILQDLLAALYAHDVLPFAERLAQDCSIIAESGRIAHGREEIADLLPCLFAEPALRLDEPRFHLLGRLSSNATYAAAEGSYRLYTASDAPLLFSAECRATACFQRTLDGRWMLEHLHLSRCSSRPAEDALLPIETSRETYDYVRRILKTARGTGLLPARIAVKNGSQTRYLDPAELLYAEARGKRCVVHSAGEETVLNEMLADLEKQLPGIFVRVHRSYVVNAAHVRSIERYVLTLSDGTQLPVPKQRFNRISRELALRVAET